ncbi:hypothetical protein FRB96_005068 [Tulasnella sp. 330]|nr:hypothetical protein FRB96_005068 [Tulasnella sp. 330]KAG8890373.1 hypothetical protein FRB98_008948 [Tulasnella sp. 332]
MLVRAGFFSIQVLDDAVKVFGLKLVRWRGEEMRPFQAQPELQPAFVLNLDSHWYTLRRFGPVALDFHWFNLNSLLKRPEYVSNTLLAMTLQQAEAEGYSVFVVRALDDYNPLSSSPLPETNLDIVAATIPRLASYKSPSGGSPVQAGSSGHNQLKGRSLLSDSFGFEDEDMELQRALQASLAEGGFEDPGPVFAKGLAHEAAADLPDKAFSAFQASMARQRETLANARREQEEALRESVQNEVASGSVRRRQTAGEEEEEEMMRRALEESMAAAKGTTAAEEDNADPIDMDASLPTTPLHTALRDLPPPEHFGGPRMLDDEDAELQAALRASLENVPEGFTVPEVPLPVRIGSRMQPVEETLAAARTTTLPVVASAPVVTQSQESASSGPPSPVVSVDVDEMRRRRLERFNNK